MRKWHSSYKKLGPIVQYHAPIFVIMILGLVSLSWFHGFMISESDILFPPNGVVNFWQRLFVWSDQSLGLTNVRWVAGLIPWSAYNAIGQFLGMPVILVQELWFYIYFTGGGVSMYLLCFYITKGRGRRLGATTAGCFYMFTPYFAIMFAQFTYMWEFYAFLPLILFLFIKGIQENRGLKYVAVMCALWTITSASLYTSPYFLIYDWGLLIAYMVFKLAFCKTIQKAVSLLKFTIMTLLVFVAMNAYWILPQYGLSTQALLSSVSTYASLGRSYLSGYELNSAPLFEAMRSMGLITLRESYMPGAPWYYWTKVYDTPAFICVGTLLFVLSFITLLSKSEKRDDKLFFAFLSLFALLWMNGSKSPFGPFNILLLTHIPFGLILAGDPYICGGAFLVLGMSVLLGRTVGFLYGKRLRIGAIVAIAVVVLICIYSFPVWHGDLVYPGNNIIPEARYEIPIYYLSAANWLKEQDCSFRLYSLPYSELGYGSFIWQHGYRGVDPTSSILGRSVVNGFGLGFTAADILTNRTIPFLVSQDNSNATIIADDSQTLFWSGWERETLTNDSSLKVTGADSLRVDVRNDSGRVIYHSYSPPQNWSSFDFISFYWYGTNSGMSWRLNVWSRPNSYDDSLYYTFTDNFNGWQRIIVPFECMVVEGSPDLTRVRQISFANLPFSGTFHIDLVTLNYIDPVALKRANETFAKVLALMNVKYLFIHNDTNWPLAHYGYLVSTPDVVHAASSLPGFELERNFGMIDFYLNNYWRPNEVFASTNALLVEGDLSAWSITEVLYNNPNQTLLFFSSQNTGKPHLNSSPFPEGTVILSYTKVSPVKYLIEANSTSPFYLVISQSYDDGWIASVNGQVLPSTCHQVANGYANSWYVNQTGALSISVWYAPQIYFYLGVTISVFTIIAITVFALSVNVRKILRKNIMKPTDENIRNAQKKSYDEEFFAQRFYRPLSRRITKIVVRTPLTPNQITVFGSILGIVAAFLFSRADYLLGLVGIILMHLSNVFDCVDGEVARFKGLESKIGGWLDGMLLKLAESAIYIGISVGLYVKHTFLFCKVDWGIAPLVIGLMVLASRFLLTSATEGVRIIGMPSSEIMKSPTVTAKVSRFVKAPVQYDVPVMFVLLTIGLLFDLAIAALFTLFLLNTVASVLIGIRVWRMSQAKISRVNST